jgi:hypothetical protein
METDISATKTLAPDVNREKSPIEAKIQLNVRGRRHILRSKIAQDYEGMERIADVT